MPEFLRANERVHHYRFRKGQAKTPVVFANSLGTDLRIWDKVIDQLYDGTPILTYDKSGHGLSENGAVSIADFAGDLAALMDALDLRNALVCGVSVGGMIAQALAASRPDLVAGLVLCNTSHRIGAEASWSERINALNANGLEAMADGILERWFASRFRRENPERITGYRAMLARTPAHGYSTVCAAIRDADLTEITKSLTCPTLCVAGAEDQATPPDVVKFTSELITDAQYICLDGVGHLPCIEAPKALAELLKERLGMLA